MNAINPLKPFKDFLPLAPKWLRIILYVLRLLPILLAPLFGAPITSCIGSETNVSTTINADTRPIIDSHVEGVPVDSLSPRTSAYLSNDENFTTPEDVYEYDIVPD